MAINYRYVLVFVLEFVATLLHVAIGCMGLIGKDPDKDSSTIAMHIGLITIVVVNCFGYLSGALLNPSISLACWSYGLIKWRMLLVYLIAQFGGGLAGYYILTVILPESMVTGSNLCVVMPIDDLTEAQVVAIEFLLTTLMVFGLSAILDVSNKADVIPFRFGAIIAVCWSAGAALTGAGLNSARIVAAAYFNDVNDNVALYLASHAVAGLLAPYLWKIILSPKARILRECIKSPKCK